MQLLTPTLTATPSASVTATPTSTLTPTLTATMTPTASVTLTPTMVVAYPEFVLGKTKVVNDSIYQYQGKCWLSQHNPGSWEMPKNGWFWSEVSCAQ